jgi:SM-20-related protein
MIELDYAALCTAPVAADPFPHVVVPNFVPPASLHAVLADLPPLGKRGSFPLDALALGPNAQAPRCGRRSLSVSAWNWTMRRPW